MHDYKLRLIDEFRGFTKFKRTRNISIEEGCEIIF
jgi:hypothetical protein